MVGPGEAGDVPPALVWYVAYGSNLLRERFLHYLCLPGAPRSDAFGHHLGCSDDTPPADERDLVVDHRLTFLGHSVRWDGPVAFLERARTPGTATFARAYLITGGQLVDLVRQENRASAYSWRAAHLPDGPHHVAPLPVGRGNYDGLLRLPDVDGRPALALTTTRPLPRSAPPAPYLDVLRRGLQERGLTAAEADRYLDGCVLSTSPGPS